MAGRAVEGGGRGKRKRRGRRWFLYWSPNDMNELRIMLLQYQLE